MISAILSAALCAICFISGFILCSLMKAASNADAITTVPACDDYIDWSKVSEGYDWIAVDEDGMICKYAGVAPRLSETLWVISIGGEPYRNATDNLTLSDAIIGPLPLWRESLRQRPVVKS